MSDSIVTQVQIGSTIYTCNTPAIYGVAYGRKKAWENIKLLMKDIDIEKKESVSVSKTTHTRGDT